MTGAEGRRLARSRAGELGGKRVISASRRTELVAHHPGYLARRLQELRPDAIHSVVIWTKDPTNLLQQAELREALAGVGQVFIHWTVTGLGGTFLEPQAPFAKDQVRLIPEVVAFVGGPLRVHWRYDPLVSAQRSAERAGNVDPELFRSLAEPFARAGVPAVHTSFATMYPKVKRRLAEQGVIFQDYAEEERRRVLGRLADIAKGLGLALLTCCEPGFERQRCIDGELLARLHPRGESCRTDRARGQRALCGCTASLDIGRYLPCPNQCLYCYANPSRPTVDAIRSRGARSGPPAPGRTR